MEFLIVFFSGYVLLGCSFCFNYYREHFGVPIPEDK